MSGQRVRVAQLVWSIDLVGLGAGSDYYGLRLASQLNPHRFESSVCAVWSTGTQPEAVWLRKLKQKGIDVRFLARRVPSPGRKDLASILDAFRELLGQRQQQIMTCHAEFCDILVSQARLKRAGMPVFVRTVHNERIWSSFPRLLGEVILNLYPLMYQVEAGVSGRIVEKLSRRPLPRVLDRQIHYLANGIDIQDTVAQRSGPSLRDSLGLPSSAFLFGSVGRLEPQKGYGWLLTAFKQFLGAGVNAYLVLVGGGSLYSQLAGRVRELGLSENVYLLGGRQDYLSILGQFDVFVSSSLWEGLSTVVMEAMALGIPVLATRVSGSPQLIAPSRTGLLMVPNNVESCAEYLLYLYRNETARRTMAQAAYEHVHNFSFASTVRGYEELYTTLATAS